MHVYQITKGTDRLSYKPGSSDLAYRPPRVDFPYLIYNRLHAEQIALENEGSVEEV